MYTATMEYEFKAELFEEACTIWKDEVLGLAAEQEGFIRMQFLTSTPKALAIGSWKAAEDAQKFMQTGVFKDLMVKLEDKVVRDPIAHIWDLRYFSEAAAETK